MKTLYTRTKNKKHAKLIGAAVGLMLLPCIAQAQTPPILSWNLRQATGNEATYNATGIDPHLSTSTLSRLNVTPTTQAQVVTYMGSNFTQTSKGDQGLTFNITPVANYQVSLTTLSYKARNIGSVPSGSFRWQYSLDGVNFTDVGPGDVVMPASQSVGGVIQTPIDLSGVAALQNVTTPITMRVVAWNVSSNTAMFGIGRSLNTAADSIVLAIAGTVTPSGTLPVTLQFFQAVAAQSNADLSWTTAMEKNSSHFNVERSSNGKDFTGIARITSKNEATGARYTYTDAGAMVNTDHQYYRLQSVDMDGTASYSKVVRVNAYNVAPAALLLYPNPATKAVTVETNLSEDGLLQVFNTTGQLVLEQKIGKAYAKTELNTSSFTKGTYMIKLQDNQQTSTRQLIIR